MPASSSAATTGTEFSVPTILFDLNLSTDESSLSSAVVSPVLEDFDPAKFLEQLSSSSMPPPPSTQTVVCPMCSKPVEDADEIADELPQLDGRRRLTMREQKIFCRAHKMHSARKDWARRGYPDIAWDELPRRIKAYAPALDDIFRGRRPSFFRRRLEHSVKAGGRRNRTAAQAMVLGGLDEASPGYYGPKGARILYVSGCFFFYPPLLSRPYPNPYLIISYPTLSSTFTFPAYWIISSLLPLSKKSPSANLLNPYSGD